MHHLAHYSSSSSSDEDSPTTAQSRLTPSPPRTTSLPVRLADPSFDPKPHTNTDNMSFLPSVVPHSIPEERYLVHVFVPIHHPQLASFSRILMGSARLKLVGAPTKPTLTPLHHFHITISRPCTIPAELITPLVTHLRKILSSIPQFSIDISNAVKPFLNKNQNRLYIAAPVSHVDTEHTLQLIHATSKVFRSHALPPFFPDPQPHISFAWTDSTHAMSLFQSPSTTTNVESALEVKVSRVVCSIGKMNYDIKLS